jgi:hypothetical protein
MSGLNSKKIIFVALVTFIIGFSYTIYRIFDNPWNYLSIVILVSSLWSIFLQIFSGESGQDSLNGFEAILAEFKKENESNSKILRKDIFNLLLPFLLIIVIIFFAIPSLSNNYDSHSQNLLIGFITFLVLLFLFLGLFVNYQESNANRSLRKFALKNSLKFQELKFNFLKSNGCSGAAYGMFNGYKLLIFSRLDMFFLHGNVTFVELSDINTGRNRLFFGKKGSSVQGGYLPYWMQIYFISRLPSIQVDLGNLSNKFEAYTSSKEFSELVLSPEIINKLDHLDGQFYIGENKIALILKGGPANEKNLIKQLNSFVSVADLVLEALRTN